MNEENLNMEIRKFLKNVGISSQRIIENGVLEANNKGILKLGDEIEVEMNLSIKSLEIKNTISGKIRID
tara:strand:- start:67 stop:273 length:207 start_codon:yes stop_codon:yes gene_type:complete